MASGPHGQHQPSGGAADGCNGVVALAEEDVDLVGHGPRDTAMGVTSRPSRSARPAGRHTAILTLASELATSFDVNPARFDRSLDEVLVHHDSLLLVAVDGETTVGYLAASVHPTLYANGPVAWIEELMVDRTARRRGVARALVAAAEEWADAEPGSHGQPGDALSSAVLDGRWLRGVGRVPPQAARMARPDRRFRSAKRSVGGDSAADVEPAPPWPSPSITTSSASGSTWANRHAASQRAADVELPVDHHERDAGQPVGVAQDGAIVDEAPLLQ